MSEEFVGVNCWSKYSEQFFEQIISFPLDRVRWTIGNGVMYSTGHSVALVKTVNINVYNIFLAGCKSCCD